MDPEFKIGDQYDLAEWKARIEAAKPEIEKARRERRVDTILGIFLGIPLFLAVCYGFFCLAAWILAKFLGKVKEYQ